MMKNLLITTERKINLVNNEIILDVLLARKKREQKRTARLIEEKRLFHLYILNIESYQCMNMCINVPW